MLDTHRRTLLVLSRRARFTFVVAVILALASRIAGAQGDASTSRSGHVRLCAGGDVLLGTNLDTTWAAAAARKLRRRVSALPNPNRLVAPLRPLVRDADIVLINIEGAVGEGAAARKCRRGSTHCYALRQPISAAAALRRLTEHGEVVGNLANNHAMDAGEAGLKATIEHLGRAGVHVTGTDTLATVVEPASADTVAILGFSTSAGPDPRDLDSVWRHVARAAARYPRLVVTMHMGAEGALAQRTRDTTEQFLNLDRGNAVAFARAAVDAGADLVVGHGPHVVRAAEWRGGALIFYSLGNLLTYGPFSLDEPMNRGAVACAMLADDGTVLHASLRSTRQWRPGFVRRDRTERAAALIDSLSRLDFPESAARLLAETAILRRKP